MTKTDLISRAKEEWRREREEATKKYNRRVALINLLGDNPDSTLNELLEWATEPKTTTTTTKKPAKRRKKMTRGAKKAAKGVIADMEPGSRFTSSWLAKRVGCSNASAVKAINDMRTSGIVERHGSWGNKNTSYTRVSSNGAVAHA